MTTTAPQLSDTTATNPTASGAILLVTMTPDPTMERAFNVWYNTEHVAPRLGLNPGCGFARTRRYVALDGVTRYINLYELDSLEVLRSPEYVRLRQAEDSFDIVRRMRTAFRDYEPRGHRRLELLETGRVEGDDPERSDALVVEVLTPQSTSPASSDAGAEARLEWALSTLTARASLDPRVARQRLLKDEGGTRYVLLTETRTRDQLIWSDEFRGWSADLPSEFDDVLTRDVVAGRLIGDFRRQPATDHQDNYYAPEASR